MFLFTFSLDHAKRQCNSLQTLCALFYAIYKKSSMDASFDMFTEIFAYGDMDKYMKILMQNCNQILLGEYGMNFVSLEHTLYGVW